MWLLSFVVMFVSLWVLFALRLGCVSVWFRLIGLRVLCVSLLVDCGFGAGLLPGV